MDIAKPYRDNCLVGLFEDGPFRHLLQQQEIPVQVLATRPIQVRRESSLFKGLSSLRQLAPLIARVALLSRKYDIIYANTLKALVVGAFASRVSRRPLVYHLHDILSTEHFSRTNRRLAVRLGNTASLVVANSKASQAAFVAAGGRLNISNVVYNGFETGLYQSQECSAVPNPTQVRQQLGLNGKFLVGHFSRMSPWKGQHVLLEALAQCPKDVNAILVGEALFGEQDYVQQLHEQVAALRLEQQVQFLGFRSDIVSLMKACDLVTHTSTLPEPFGRVIVEAMLCGRPVVAAAAGGAVELVEPGINGWLVPAGDPKQLAEVIMICRDQPEAAASLAKQAQIQASHRFDLTATNQQLSQLLSQIKR